MKNLLIIGYGRGGKDTAAEYLRDKHNYRFTSSSAFACEKFICNSLKNVLGYASIEECYDDRHNYRDLWYNLISAYNSKDKCRIAKEMLNSGYNIYVGMRSYDELVAAKESKTFDLIIWVDGVARTGYIEPATSCTVSEDMADVVVENNGSLEEFYKRLDEIVTNKLE